MTSSNEISLKLLPPEMKSWLRPWWTINQPLFYHQWTINQSLFYHIRKQTKLIHLQPNVRSAEILQLSFYNVKQHLFLSLLVRILYAL